MITSLISGLLLTLKTEVFTESMDLLKMFSQVTQKLLINHTHFKALLFKVMEVLLMPLVTLE